jgi:hypothetical protein
LRAILKKKERIASQKLISLPLSRDSPYANSEPASNRSSVTSETLQVVSAILPRTIRLCVGNEHRRPHASRVVEAQIVPIDPQNTRRGLHLVIIAVRLGFFVVVDSELVTVRRKEIDPLRLGQRLERKQLWFRVLSFGPGCRTKNQ